MKVLYKILFFSLIFLLLLTLVRNVFGISGFFSFNSLLNVFNNAPTVRIRELFSSVDFIPLIDTSTPFTITMPLIGAVPLGFLTPLFEVLNFISRLLNSSVTLLIGAVGSVGYVLSLLIYFVGAVL